MSNRINTKIALDFLELQEKLPQIIESFDVNINKMCKSIGISKQTYYNKKEKKTFTGEEMKKICDYINR